jgi:hypothetical protein
MKFNEFKETMLQNYSTVFKDGECEINGFNNLGKGIVISIYANKEIDVTRMNDALNVSLFIELPGNFNFNTDELPENLVAEVWHKSYATRPENQYCVYGSKIVPLRKIKGNAAKMENKIDDYFKMLYNMLVEDFVNNNFTENFKPVISKMIGIEK